MLTCFIISVSIFVVIRFKTTEFELKGLKINPVKDLSVVFSMWNFVFFTHFGCFLCWLVRSKFLMHKWMWITLNSFKAAEHNQIRNLKYSSKCLNIVNKWKCCIGMPTDKSTYTHGRHKIIHRCTPSHTHIYR